MAEAKNKKKIIYIAMGCGIMVAIVTAIFLSNAFKDNETYTSNTNLNESIGILDCKSNDPLDAFFTTKRTLVRSQHEIRVTFASNRPEKISYIYTGAFENKEDNSQGTALFQADFNNYLGKNDVDPGSLYPTFNTTDNEFKIVVYAEKKTLNDVTAKVFFLSEGESEKFFEYTPKGLGNIYKNKGFSCSLDE